MIYTSRIVRSFHFETICDLFSDLLVYGLHFIAFNALKISLKITSTPNELTIKLSMRPIKIFPKHSYKSKLIE